MDNILASNFQLMRFNILSAARDGIDKSPFDAAYVYAWDNGVYPFFHPGADWHEPFKECFKLSESDMDVLSKVLDDHWMQNKPITFYELEEHFGVQGAHRSSTEWSRGKLIAGCRYMFLNEGFDRDFWATLTENMKCPAEAHSIARAPNEEHIYFM